MSDEVEDRYGRPPLEYCVNGGSPESVAFALMAAIARNDNKTDCIGQVKAEKKWVLETFSACLAVVKGENAEAKKKGRPDAGTDR